MFTKKALPVWVLFASLLSACGSTVPAKTNVLNKNAPPRNQQPAKKPAPVTNQQKQTVFTRPQQVTGNNNTQQPTQRTPATSAPQRDDTYVAAEAEAGKTYAYRSPEYYRHITDSIQRYYAKNQYNKTLDEVIKQISDNPGSKRNPAVNATQWNTTVNFNARKPNFVILHHTGQNSADQTLFTFSISRTGVSAHYVVGRDGIVHQMLNDYLRAWHAGNSKWGNVTDINSSSIGIEIDNNSEEPYSESQIHALIKLLDYLKDEYNIPQANFIAHSDIAPGRKSDPSKYFPWKKLADAGFGFWYDSYNMVTPPADFNALLAMRVMGYDISNQSAAIRAFKLHYIQTDTNPVLTDYDKKILYNVYRKF